MSDTSKIVEAAEFMKRAVALRLKLTRIGSRRAVDTDDVDTGDAEKDLIRVTKEILDSEELKAIRNHDIETRAAIRQRALPSLLGTGWYLIPVGAVEAVDAFITERAESRDALIGLLIEALPALKDRSKARLGHLWNEDQFPTPEVVRDKSKVASRYVTFDTPASLKGISKAILDREVQKAQREASAARDAAVALLREEMQKAVSALADAFTPGPNGKKKGLKPATLDKVTQALNLFQARNIAQDEKLTEFVEQAKALIAGKSAKDLKLESKTEGSEIVSKFQGIKASLAGLIEEGPGRVIDFEE